MKTFSLFDLRIAATCWLAAFVVLPYVIQRTRQRSPPTSGHVRTWPAKLLVSLWVSTGALLGCEYFFRYHHVGTDGVAVTWRTYRWLDLHWRENSWGFRDVEHQPTALERPTVAVVGDSFAAGWGIDSLDDCMVRVMQRELGLDVVTVLLAKPGWGPLDQAQALDACPSRIDVVVVNYFINDIERAASASGCWNRRPIAPRKGIVSQIEESSALANHLYWQLYRYRHGTDLADSTTTLYGLNDPEMWAIHDQDLEQLREAVQRRGARLVVAVWPNLLDFEVGEQIRAHASEFFRSRNVTVIELAEVFADDPTQELVVSRYDSHPGVYAHRKASDAIASVVRPMLESQGSQTAENR